MTSPAIFIKGLSKHYANGVKALDQIDLEIQKGEFIALLGPNGAGKSTLINILGGVVNRSGGIVQVFGKDVTRDFRFTRRQLGVVPQEVSFEMMFSVWETLEYQSGYFGFTRNQKRIEELLEIFHLSDKKKMNARMLSGGMKRRLMICKALVHDPEIIVLDEPTAGVDVELRAELWEYIRSLNRKGKTIILTTHYLEEAEQLCEKIGIINQGKMTCFEPKSSLMKRILNKQLICTGNWAEESFVGFERLSFEFHKADQQLKMTFSEQDWPLVLKWVSAYHSRIHSFYTLEPDLQQIFLKLIHTKD